MSLPIYQRVAVTDAGDVIPGAEYTVINENTGVAAPIYSDRTGATLLSAPYFADSVGTIQFFIAQGTTFRVAASGGVGSYTDRYVYGVAEAVLVQADGNVEILSGNFGIGTSSPAAQLEVWGAPATYNFSAGTDPLVNAAIISDNVNAGTGPALVLGSVYSGDNTVANARIFAERQSTGASNAGATDLIFEVGQASGSALVERLRIESAGNVGIGTSSPIYPLSVSGEASIDLFNTTGGGQVLNFRPEFGDSNKYNMSISSYDHATGSGDSDGLSINGYDGVSICTGSSTSRLERVRIDNAGHVIAGGGLTLGNGQVYSADKTLDDYEEGIWTPRYVGSGVAGSSPTGVGTYTKVGRMITVTANFGNFNVSGATGDMRISGLPFTPSSASNNLHTGAATTNGLGADVLVSSILVNEGYIRLRIANTTIFKTVVNANNRYLYTTVTYETA